MHTVDRDVTTTLVISIIYIFIPTSFTRDYNVLKAYNNYFVSHCTRVLQIPVIYIYI